MRPPPMLKPGETLESNRSKYLNPGNYPTPSACLLGMRDKTISVMMSQGLTLSDYHVPDPLGISAAFSNKPATKPCAGMTMSRHSYGRSSSDHAACPTFHQPKWSSSVACDLIVEDQTKSTKASNQLFYHQHNLPGYAGFNPSIAKNDKGPRFSGSSPQTSSGAMTSGEIL